MWLFFTFFNRKIILLEHSEVSLCWSVSKTPAWNLLWWFWCLPFLLVLSGSRAGLDAPQAGAVFVGADHGQTAAAPTSKGRWWEGQRCGGEMLRRRHSPETYKEAQNKITKWLHSMFYIKLAFIKAFISNGVDWVFAFFCSSVIQL